METHGSDDRPPRTVAAIVFGIVGAAIGVYLLYLLTGFAPPLGASSVEIVVGLVSFGLLFLLLNRLVYPKFEQVYAERAERIEGALVRAEETRAEAMQLKADYDEQIAVARADASRIRDEARAEGSEVRAELRAEAEAEAATAREQATQELDRQSAAAATALRDDLGELSTRLAEKILGTTVAPSTPDALSRHLAELEGPRTPAAN